MRAFKDLSSGDRFFVCGGFELQKVQSTPDYNAVLLDYGKSTDIWVTLPDDKLTYPDEDSLREAYPDSGSTDGQLVFL